jgi:hypothetical protein
VFVGLKKSLRSNLNEPGDHWILLAPVARVPDCFPLRLLGPHNFCSIDARLHSTNVSHCSVNDCHTSS